MALIRMRKKRQITIPASIIAQANLADDTLLDIAFVGGVNTLTPRIKNKKKDDILSYAGIFRGAWGNSGDEFDLTTKSLRDEWER
jgi:hypothetical protein